MVGCGVEKKDTVLVVTPAMGEQGCLEALQDSFTLQKVMDGKSAWDMIVLKNGSIAAILWDSAVPMWDGKQLLKWLNGFQIPLLLLVSPKECQENKGWEWVTDVLPKSIDPVLLQWKIRNLIARQEKLCQKESLALEQQGSGLVSFELVSRILGAIIANRNQAGQQHSDYVRLFTKLLLEEVSHSHAAYALKPATIQRIASASVLHDLGKILIPDEIVLKKGPLTQDEFAVMKTHVVKGCDILQALDFVADKEYFTHCYAICRFHHERWDGHGYPDGLAGDKIPLSAQVVGLVDAYDALTSARVYKPAYEHDVAVDMIMKGACGIFSPALLACFQRVSPQFATLRLREQRQASERNDRG